jgi:peroxiredoxin
MDLNALSDLSLPDPNGTEHRLGDLWQDKPVIVVFLRHFGCHNCRDHAVQLRDRYDDLQRQGIDLVAIGTGDQGYAGAFVRDEKIPYLVLVDDDAKAAQAASVKVASWYRLLHPSSWAASVQAWKRGARIHKAGKRVTQLGATFVFGPGNQVRYSHVDDDSVDHAPVPEILAAVGV